MEHFKQASTVNPAFSVVIPTYRRHKSLCQCLDGLAPYFHQAALHRHPPQSIEVIVSDDAHEQELQTLLQHRYPWCRYTRGPGYGPAANRNHGARQALGQWLVFTDDDCIPQPGWIESYAQLADKHDVMEGKTLPTGTRTRIDEECPVNETGGYLWSCNFAIKRELFLRLGGFNENFPAAAMEDIELRTRIYKHRLVCMFNADAVVFHPWRLRKGFAFTKSHSLSVGQFVRLHPEKAQEFSFAEQMIKTIRILKQTVSLAITQNLYRGLARQLSLICYSNFMTWRAVRAAYSNLH